MDWAIIGTSILGGGIFGQILTLYGTSYLTDRREFKKWRFTERYQAINNILDVLTSNPIGDDLNQWTHEIRNASLKIHVLYNNGAAPKLVADQLEEVFTLAKTKKSGESDEKWSEDFRKSVSELKRQLSLHINVN